MGNLKLVVNCLPEIWAVCKGLIFEDSVVAFRAMQVTASIRFLVGVFFVAIFPQLKLGVM